MKAIVLLGRILFSLIFIVSGFRHFSEAMIQYGASQNVPLPHLLVPLSGLIALLGGLSILLGYRARWGAWLIVLFLIPVTFKMHAFWTLKDPQEVMINHIMFVKNLSMLGAALLISYFGSGPLSIDKNQNENR